MDTLKNLIVENKEDLSQIFFLKVINDYKVGLFLKWILDSYIDRKVDIEGYELDALPEWMESGALEKVFLSQKVIQAEYIPGGPVGYGASS